MTLWFELRCVFPPILVALMVILSDGHRIVGSEEKSVSREISFVREGGSLAREPSFIYDTSVEAFGTKATTIDEVEEDDEEESGGVGISIIGRIAEEIDLSSPIDPFQPGPDFLHLSGDFDQSSQSSFDAGLQIPFSSSPSAVEHVYLNPMDKAMGVNIAPFTKRLSCGGSKISSTPEGETYFMQREESFIKKVHQGELQSMAVEVSDYFSLDSVSEELTVRPVLIDSGAEIEITDLRPDSSLTVKPVEFSAKRAPVSSYETIYDQISLEEIASDSTMTKEQILASLGERFHGTQEIPEGFSSFEELYQFSDGQVADTVVVTSEDNFGRRWTAPAGTVEPPILEAEEFSLRYEPVVERTQGHWEDIEKIIGGAKKKE